MGENDNRPVATITVAGPQRFDPQTRQALLDLAEQIEVAGFDVKIPIRRTSNSVWASLASISIQLGDQIADDALGAAVGALTTSAILWAKNKFKRDADEGKKPEAKYITIYGPDGKPLKNILAKSADEIKDVTPRENED